MRARFLIRAIAAAILAVAILGLAVGCSSGLTDAGATHITLADGSSALQWGDGEYGVVLVPGEGENPEAWAELATEIAANRMTIVAVDEVGATADRLAAAAEWLSEREIERIAYIGSGRRGGQLIAAVARSGIALDQIILVSGSLTGDELTRVGEPPKLFGAAEHDAVGAADATRMAAEAPGSWNALLLVPGSDRGSVILDGEGADDLTEGVMARLEERR